jgi:hypothetical protein
MSYRYEPGNLIAFGEALKCSGIAFYLLPRCRPGIAGNAYLQPAKRRHEGRRFKHAVSQGQLRKRKFTYA